MSKKLHFTIPSIDVLVPAPGVAEPDTPRFSVRGVTLQDLSYLMQNHGTSVVTLYGKYVTQDIDLTDGQTLEIASSLVGEMPELIAAIIARASSGALDEDTAINLTLPVQVEAVVAIGQLTFTGEGALEKFLVAAAKMMEAAAAALAKTTTLPMPGAGTETSEIKPTT